MLYDTYEWSGGLCLFFSQENGIELKLFGNFITELLSSFVKFRRSELSNMCDIMHARDEIKYPEPSNLEPPPHITCLSF